MNETRDVDAYRRAVHAVARDHEAPVAAAIYAGAVTAAMRRSQLAGGGQFTDMLLTELTGDRLACLAAVEVGPVGCLSLEQWTYDVWEGIAERAAETVPPALTEAEAMYRRATIELLSEAGSDSASITFAAALSVANVRWYAAGADPATAFVRSVLDEDPVAELARDQLDETVRASLAMSVGNRWRVIMERVAVMVAVYAIEAAA